MAKLKELVIYVFFGGLTTLVSIVSYQGLEWFLLPRWGDHSYLFSKIVAFVLALAFAFVVNKRFVFQQRSWERRQVLRELLTFSAARVVSFVLVEYIAVFVAFDLIWPRLELRFSPWWLQTWPQQLPAIAPMDAYRFLTQWCIIQVIVVLLNYVFSKWVVFKQSKSPEGIIPDTPA